MPLASGETFAGYTIVRLLGAGAMGEVYLAQHPRLPRRDALKVMAAQVSTDAEYRERFNREAQNAAALWHQNIVAVHDRGEDEGRLWIAMDYVEGTDAGQLLTQKEYRRGLPPADVVRIVAAVADALDYAHQHQLLHRDVKPANILLANFDSGGWRALLADFGIARRVDDSSGLTETNMAVGTVAYAAPEQLMGQTLDGRADQYSLAATAFELLTGTHLYLDRNPAVVISQHVSAPPPAIADRKPELSGLGPVLAKALAKLPADRYDTCTAFATALAATPPSSMRRWRRPPRRRPPDRRATACGGWGWPRRSSSDCSWSAGSSRASSLRDTRVRPPRRRRHPGPRYRSSSSAPTARSWDPPASPRPDRRPTARACPRPTR
jgi:serine/threonine protein kinase, bacterial